MRAEAIFGPVSALALWTGVVLMMTGARRILAVRAGRLRSHAFRLGESAEVPEDVAVPNRNLMNLLEMPVLFYVACIAFYVTRRVNTGVVVMRGSTSGCGWFTRRFTSRRTTWGEGCSRSR